MPVLGFGGPQSSFGQPLAPRLPTTCVNSPSAFLQMIFGPTQCFASDENAAARLVLSDLSLTPSDEDWFRFELSEDGAAGESLDLLPGSGYGRLEMTLFDLKDLEAVKRAAASSSYLPDATPQLDRVATGDGQQQIDLEGLPPGDYLVRIRALDEATIPGYVLAVSARPALISDWAEPSDRGPSDTDPQFHDLRTVEGMQVVSDLSLHCRQYAMGNERNCEAADVDWFAFTLTAAATAGHLARIDFDHRLGDLELALYDEKGEIGESGGNQPGRPGRWHLLRQRVRLPRP
jgi:hypothetical protein